LRGGQAAAEDATSSNSSANRGNRTNSTNSTEIMDTTLGYGGGGGGGGGDNGSGKDTTGSDEADHWASFAIPSRTKPVLPQIDTSKLPAAAESDLEPMPCTSVHSRKVTPPSDNESESGFVTTSADGHLQPPDYPVTSTRTTPDRARPYGAVSRSAPDSPDSPEGRRKKSHSSPSHRRYHRLPPNRLPPNRPPPAAH